MAINRTLLNIGSFTSDGADKTLSIRSDFDYIVVENETQLIQATADKAFMFEWQRGMTDGRGVVWTKLGNVASDPLTVGQIAASGGFVLVDHSGARLQSSVVVTGASNATEPVFDTATTTGLSDGVIVRIQSMDEQVNLNGYDFAIDNVIASTSFKMAAPLATAPGVAETTGGTYRIVNFDPLFYPRFRYIANITSASQAVVTTTVPSGYAVGQKVRVIVPQTSQAGVSDYGMVEIDGLQATVVAVNDAVGTQTVTLDIDSSGFTAFTFPTAAKAAVPLSRAMLVPSAMNVSYARAQSVDELSDARSNQGLIGVRLVGGADGPGGASSDVMYWRAFKAQSVDNE